MINLHSLPNQERGEVTVLFLRRYWIDLAHAFLFSAVLLAVPLALWAAMHFSHADVWSEPFWGPAAALMLSSYLLVVAVITMAQVSDYFLDMWIVTNERIINIEQLGLFSRKVSEMRLNQVQDVSSETHGFLETFLTYGDVTVQTAGQRLQFHFKNINDPDEVKVKVAQLVTDCKKRHGDGAIAQEVQKTDKPASDAT